MPTITETAPVEVEALLGAFDLGRVTSDLRQLCQADFAGRRLSSDGHDRAQAWLKDRMDELGLEVELVSLALEAEVLDVYDTPLFEIEDDRRLLRYRIDYAEHPRSPDLPETIAGRRWATVDAVPRGE